MFHRRAHITAGLVLATLLLGCGSAWLLAQAAPREFFIVCIGQAPPAASGTTATFYFSGVLQGPATALVAFRTAFAQYLAQRYAFKGVPACSPGNTEAIAQTFVTQRSTALRNAKFNVVDTGWIETAEAAAAASAAPARGAAAPATQANAGTAANAGTTANRAAGGRGGAPTAAPPENASGGSNARGQSGASGNASSGNSNSPEAEVASILGALFGTNKTGGNSGGSASGAGGTSTGGSGATGRQGQNTAGRGGNGSGTSGAAINQTPASQISSTLTTVFSNKSTAATNGARGPNGALGVAEFGMTKLVVYGCGRQDVQVACVTELTNENAKDSLVLSANVWKDAFLVDDRGDRHLRTNGFFLNIDGEQRQQLDISVGKTAKFILMFDNIQTRVQKVTLRSQTGGLDVEDIGLLSADTGQGAAAATPASPQR